MTAVKESHVFRITIVSYQLVCVFARMMVISPETGFFGAPPGGAPHWLVPLGTGLTALMDNPALAIRGTWPLEL